LVQHDKNFANQPFPPMRADMNNFNLSEATQNSGTSFPAATFEFLPTVNTTNNAFYYRNSGNTSWIPTYRIDMAGNQYSGGGAPTAEPLYNGELYYDTTNTNLYIARGATSGDWGLVSQQGLANYYDVRGVSYSSSSSITIETPIVVQSASGATQMILESGSIVVSTATTGAGGLDTGTVSADTWYYLYLISDDQGTTVSAVLSTTNEASSGTIVLPPNYTQKRQLKSAVRTDSSSQIIRFGPITDNQTIYATDTANLQLLTGGTSSSFANVDLSSLVPATARKVLLRAVLMSPSGLTIINIRDAAAAGNGHSVPVGAGALQYLDILMPCTSGQMIQYQIATGSGSLGIIVLGYTVTEVA